VMHGAQSASREAVAQHVKTFAERLQSYPDWPELDDLEQCAACVVPMKDRPVEEPDVTSAGAR
jgi:glutathione-regulated potassium-efflux system ancillary protein KefF